MNGQTGRLAVTELYGPVWQGEGPSSGRVCSFLRLAGCNLTCGWKRGIGGLLPVEGAWQCDEPATWHAKMRTPPVWMNAGEVIDYHAKVSPRGGAMLVITGGEPLLQQDRQQFRDLLFAMSHHRIEVETNGTIAPTIHTQARVAQFNVSPKLDSSGVDLEDRFKLEVLQALNRSGKAVFKIVCADTLDVWDARRLCDLVKVPAHRRWIMPEGIDPDAHLETARRIAPAVKEAGFNLTLRQHTLLYGTAKEPRQ
jgi:organic radical activating enzyme